jgi:allantoin racemase
MQRIVLVNPNTSEPLTALMVEIAREFAPESFRIDGMTAQFGAPLLTNETEVDEAARAVRALAPQMAPRPSSSAADHSGAWRKR